MWESLGGAVLANEEQGEEPNVSAIAQDQEPRVQWA
jgi:hypothetical protein